MSEALIASVAFPDDELSTGNVITPYYITSSTTIYAKNAFKAVFVYASGMMPYDINSNIYDGYNGWLTPGDWISSPYGGISGTLSSSSLPLTINANYSNATIIVLCIE